LIVKTHQIVLAPGGGFLGEGIQIHTNDTTVKGLAIGGFGRSAIEIKGNDNKIQGNFVGTDPTGLMAAGQEVGVLVEGGSTGNLIGGTNRADRNLISANDFGIVIWDGSDNNTVQGNYIGTDATGAAGLGNTADGIEIYTSGNLIGGPETEAANLISSNGAAGVEIQGNQTQHAQLNWVLHNRIGTKADGTGALPNTWGVGIFDGLDHRSGQWVTVVQLWAEFVERGAGRTGPGLPR
jgi:parallel beta-helix repeat protein